MSTLQDGSAEEPAAADDNTSAVGHAVRSDEGTHESTGQDAGTSPRERLRGWFTGWFTGRLPAGWFITVPAIEADREGITVIGTLPDPQTAGDASDAERAAAAEGRIPSR